MTIGVIGAVALVGYLIYTHYQKTANSTSLTVGGLRATIPTQTLLGGVASIIGDVGGLFNGSTSGNGGSITPDYSQYNNAYDPSGTQTSYITGADQASNSYSSPGTDYIDYSANA